jgi:CubicO group peptidase (beta-lactamase class C family)
MKFRGKLLEDTIRLDMLFMDLVIATTNLSRSNGDWEFGTTDLTNDQSVETPPQLNDGWITANIKDCDIKQAPLVRMINNINGKKLPNTHSVLITKGNKLVFEAYFHGYNAVIPHDMRSASKSISSAMIGIAIEDNMINGVDQNLYHCLPVEYQYTTGSLKDQISIQDLLTMSSGLDVNGQAAENHYQNTGHWLKTVLESPMKDEPGFRALYGSANPFLLGVCLNELLDKPLELYMDQALLSPLGITNYIIQTDETLTTPYFGGGMHLTSSDMLKFGQLYLNRGKWMEKQILSAHWVAESFEKHVRLEDVKDKNEYGYQWWHNTYIVDNEEIESVEARGAGGQYIFVIPALESVAVITSGNFRNGRLLQQPEKILEQYILPAILD